MPQARFLEQKPRSPTGLVIVVAVHAAVLSALALSKMEMPIREVFNPMDTFDVLLPKEPPPLPPVAKKEPQDVPQHKSVMTRTDPIVKTTTSSTYSVPKEDPVELSWVDTKPGPIVIPPSDPPRKPLPDPVRMEARLDPRSELLPPYPQEEVRAGREGNVTIRVLIGTDGRVKQVERVAAASDAFWRETQRHVLRNWRFKPATLDGKPVESSKTMTVRFVLDS